MSSPTYSYDDISDFLDAELHLVGEMDADEIDHGFDRMLEEFVGSGDAEPLSDSLGSSGMDLNLEALDLLDESCEEEVVLPSLTSYHDIDRRSARRGKRGRSPSPRRKVQIDFDPSLLKQQQQQGQTRQRGEDSVSAISMCSMEPPPSAQCSAPSTAPATDQKCQQQQQLKKLADSMKRSEATRRAVMMQRDLLRPEERRALCLAKDLLNRGHPMEQQRAQQQQQAQLAQHRAQQQQAQQQLSSFGMPSFLFNGGGVLEQSRKRINMYMGQVNHNTI